MTGNILDYLEWYGRFGFDIIPFNEVDNLILAELSYATIEGIVPAPKTGLDISVSDAAEALRQSGLMETCCKLEYNAGTVLYAMADSERFKNARLSCYVNKHDFSSEEQFAALHIIIDDKMCFVAFAGTDDTILGWKEDMNMAYQMPVPSQVEAVGYLEETIKDAGHDLPIYIGGHSKGGNLAIYASIMCSRQIRDRIVRIYNNDGPGFLKSVTQTESYLEVADRICTIVPETSIVGMMLEHGEEYDVVKSNSRGIMQHDGLSWQVYRDEFVKVDARSKNSMVIDKSFTSWLAGLDDERRMEFVDTIYGFLTKAGITRLSDLEHYNLSTFNTMIKEVVEMNPKQGKMLRWIFRAFLMEYGKNMVKEKSSMIMPELPLTKKED